MTIAELVKELKKYPPNWEVNMTTNKDNDNEEDFSIKGMEIWVDAETIYLTDLDV